MNVLPDSRLHDPRGTVMVDWPLPGGRTVRIEAEPVYCANCGKLYGYVPKENTAFTCWLCGKCFEAYGPIADTCVQPDHEFCQAVAYEVERRFGRGLTEEELATADIGEALRALERDSPYCSAYKRTGRQA